MPLNRPQRARRRAVCRVSCARILLLLGAMQLVFTAGAVAQQQQAPVSEALAQALTGSSPANAAAVAPSSQLKTSGQAVTVQEVPATASANRLGFTDRDTLPPNGGYAVYNFDTKEPGLGVPDVLLTVKASPASVALYCNPAWVTLRDEGNKIAGPLNAIFQFEATSATGNIFLARDNPVARPPEARVKGTDAYNKFVPRYNCTVINYDTDLPAHYTLSATFNFHDVKLNDQEQSAMRVIWNNCCRGRTREADLEITSSTDGLLDSKLRALTCGQWVAINEANQVTPYLDFCNVVGNACNQNGQLTQFNMNGWNLGGTFPTDQLARFSALSELDLSNNPDMRADLKQIFDALAGLENLQVVELTGNAGMSGTFGYEATVENNQRSSLCVTVEGGLRILNMNGLGLTGLAIPDCLMGKQSTLEEVRIANNGIVGTIPDVFDNTSPLQYLSARNNQLTGTIPSTLGLAADLQTLDLAGNELTGDIPRILGSPPRLRFLYLGFNQLSGSVPSTLALHDKLEALDLRDNELSQIPTEWQSAGNALIAQAPLVYLRIADNRFDSSFPQTLAKLPKLAVLDMKNNHFMGDLPAIRGMFTSLRYFDASNNSFSGFIPQAWADTGIVRLKPTEAALINQFQQTVNNNGKDLEGFGRVTFQQVFNVSRNRFEGTAPIWMFADNMPSWAEQGIDISHNNMTIDCSKPLPTQLEYLTARRACPQFPSADALRGIQGAKAADQAAAAPLGHAPAISPAAAPAVVQAVETPDIAPADFNPNDTSYVSPQQLGSTVDSTVSNSSTGSGSGNTSSGGGGSSKSSSGGLPGWAKAVIAISVVLVVALAAVLAWVLYKRGPGHQRGFISAVTRSRPSGFSRFVDAQDAEAGHSSGKAGFGNAQLNGSGSPHSGTHYGVAAAGFSDGAANGSANGYASGNSLSHR